MKYEDLFAANEQMKTTDIKGTDYVEVNERVKAFRKLFPEGTIETELIEDEEEGEGEKRHKRCIFKAVAKNEEGKVLATGHAYETEGSSFINKTSYLENCETSAVGRCLGMLGIGIDAAICSYEEKANADAHQTAQKWEKTANEKIPETHVKALVKKCKDSGVEVDFICKAYKVDKFADLTNAQFRNISDKWNNIVEASKGEKKDE